MKPPNKAVVKVMKGLHFGLLTCGPVERRIIKKQTRRAVRRDAKWKNVPETNYNPAAHGRDQSLPPKP